MRLIGIVGHGNGAGKTLFLERLIAAFPGRFAALKFTTVFKDGNCPKDAQRRCACTRLHESFTILTNIGGVSLDDSADSGPSDAETIGMPNTDTGRLVAAGADPVLWCLAKPGEHELAWEHLRELLPPGKDIVTEGNSALLVVPSDVLIFLVNPAMPRKFWKSNWLELAVRAHVVVVNDAPEAIGRRRPASAAEKREAMAEVHEAAPETPRVVARLEAPWEEWAGDLLSELVAGNVTSGA